ncbi:MAG: acyl carrier protein [Bacteroidales bacterium]|jgi:acyl carrier protein|nr:acyl carrier protein [Mariniphaga sp.]NLB92671.1 acyl carrier protein [Bacteroidales bacterium]
MEKSEVSEKVSQIIVSVVKHERFEMRDDLTAADVDGWDSLTHMTIISEIEEAFDIKFKLKELNKLKNMGSLIDLIQSKLQ